MDWMVVVAVGAVVSELVSGTDFPVLLGKYRELAQFGAIRGSVRRQYLCNYSELQTISLLQLTGKIIAANRELVDENRDFPLVYREWSPSAEPWFIRILICASLSQQHGRRISVALEECLGEQLPVTAVLKPAS